MHVVEGNGVADARHGPRKRHGDGVRAVGRIGQAPHLGPHAATGVRGPQERQRHAVVGDAADGPGTDLAGHAHQQVAIVAGGGMRPIVAAGGDLRRGRGGRLKDDVLVRPQHVVAVGPVPRLECIATVHGLPHFKNPGRAARRGQCVRWSRVDLECRPPASRQWNPFVRRRFPNERHPWIPDRRPMGHDRPAAGDGCGVVDAGRKSRGGIRHVDRHRRVSAAASASRRLTATATNPNPFFLSIAEVRRAGLANFQSAEVTVFSRCGDNRNQVLNHCD